MRLEGKVAVIIGAGQSPGDGDRQAIECQGEPAPPATSSEAGSHPYVVILPDNGRDPEVT